MLRVGTSANAVPEPTVSTIEAQLYLVTRNTRDMRHTGAAVFNPWEDNADVFKLSS